VNSVVCDRWPIVRTSMVPWIVDEGADHQAVSRRSSAIRVGLGNGWKKT